MHPDILSKKQKELLPLRQLFSENFFRAQLAFHKDIDYAEQIEYMSGFETDEHEIKEFLIDQSLQII